MDRFIVEDPRVAAAFSQHRAAESNLAPAQAAAAGLGKKRHATELGLIWLPPKRVGAGWPDRRWLYHQTMPLRRMPSQLASLQIRLCRDEQRRQSAKVKLELRESAVEEPAESEGKAKME